MSINYRLKHYKAIEKTLEHDISELRSLLFGNHYSELFDNRRDAQLIIERKLPWAETAKLLKPLAAKEKNLLSLIAKSNKALSSNGIQRLVKMESELGEVKGELYFLERKYAQ